jgi:hypothetical protein
MTNRIASEELGYPYTFLEGKSLTCLMPHNFIEHLVLVLEHYLSDDKTLYKKPLTKEVWFLKANMRLVKYYLTVELVLSPKDGLVMTSFLKKIEKITIGTETYD